MRRIQRKTIKQPNEEGSQVKRRTNRQISFYCDTFLLDKVRSALESRQLAGDYKYGNFSQVIRLSLEAYKDGMALKSQREKENPRQEVSFRIDQKLSDFYQSLPVYSKSAIIERALATWCQSNLFT